MREAFVEALVLSRHNVGELDSIVSLYTKEFGKVTARAKSTRKITSKLSPYLEPLNLIRARIVERTNCYEGHFGGVGFQVVDALGVGRFQVTPQNFQLVSLVDQLTLDLDPDPRLFNVLCESLKTDTQYKAARTVLMALGYDPAYAVCVSCGKLPEWFLKTQTSFYCSTCARKIVKNAFQYTKDELVSIL